MAFLRWWPVLLILAGCTGQAVNRAQLYTPVSGVLQLEIKIPDGEKLTKVQFQVNDEVLSEDEDGSDGFSAELDTTTLPTDELVKIAAVGVRVDGSSLVLRENFIRVEGPPGEADEEADAEE